jgi:hypothetical protein
MLLHWQWQYCQLGKSKLNQADDIADMATKVH